MRKTCKPKYLLVAFLLSLIVVSQALLFPFIYSEASAAESYLWPTPDASRITQSYNGPYNGSNHSGIDIAGSGTIVATKSGTVKRVYYGCNNYGALGKGGHSCDGNCSPNAGKYKSHGKDICNWGYGNGVIIQHDDGSGYSMYAHMQNNVLVNVGDHVNQGDALGYIGASGMANGAHLHFELCGSINRKGTYDEPVNSINSNVDSISYVHTPGAGAKLTDDEAMLGYLDSCSGGEGFIQVGGWGIDKRIIDKGWVCAIQVYVNGEEKALFNASLSRPDVNQYYGVTNCGFDEKISMGNDSGVKKVEVYLVGLNWAKKLLGTKTVTVTKKPDPVTVTISKPTMSMKVGEQASLSATVTPASTSNKTIKWTSSNEKVVTVNNGKITAVGEGTAVVNAGLTYVPAEGKWQDQCTITVTKKAEPINVKISQSQMSMKVGDQSVLSATVTPANTANKALTWTSSDTKVVTVNNGKISAVGEGTATITASLSYVPAEGKGKDSCTITVTKQQSTTVYANSVKMSKTSIQMNVGETATLSATVSPSNATDKALTWSSSDERIATVSNGKVTAVSAGTVTIKASLNYVPPEGTWYDTCQVTVKAKGCGKTPANDQDVHVTDLSVNRTDVTLKAGESVSVTATVHPCNATNKSVVWTTDNQNIASVNNGTIKGVAPGKTRVTVYSTDVYNGSHECWITVNVEDAAKANPPADTNVYMHKVFFDRKNAELTPGESITLSYRIEPSNATNKNELRWTSSNTAVATVSNGTIYAVAPGTAEITADVGHVFQDAWSEYFATCTITVKEEAPPVTGLSLSQTEITLHNGDCAQLSAFVAPANARNATVSWYSECCNVARVDNNGAITAVGTGDTRIVATSEDGGYTAICIVHVKEDDYIPVTAVAIMGHPYVSGHVGDMYYQDVVVCPSNATNQRGRMTSSNEDVAVVVDGHWVVLMAEGEADITVTMEDGGYSYTRTFYVQP